MRVYGAVASHVSRLTGMAESWTPAKRYAGAASLAIVAQIVRTPLHLQTLTAYITYIPFVLLGAFVGWGPGLLTTGTCIFEAIYFAGQPIGALAGDPQHAIRLGLVAITGMTASGLFEGLRQWRRAESRLREDREQMVSALEIQTRRFESMFEYAPAMIAVLRGPDFVIDMVNPACQAMHPNETLVGRTAAEAWPEAADVVLPLLRIVRDAQKVYHATGMALRTRRGNELPVEERYFDLSFVPLAASNDADVQVLVVAIDVTEYKQTEKALRAAHQELATIHANIPIELFVVDEKLRAQGSRNLAAVSDSVKQRPPEAPCRIDAIGCLNSLEKPAACGASASCDTCAVRDAVLDTLRTGARHEGIEAWVPATAGGEQQNRWFLISTAPMQLDGKKALICAQDITKRKEIEKEVESQRDRLQHMAELIRFSHDAIISLDADRVIKAWNKGAEEVYGWTEQEAAGNVTHDLLKTGSHLSNAEVDEQLLRNGRWDGELQHQRKDGSRIVVESRHVIQRDAAGAVLGILEINRDITDRKKSEEALRETLENLASTVKEKTILLQEVHHRVKNNLAVICSLLEMSAAGSDSGDARLALKESQQRVHSIALIHEHLYGADHFDRVNFSDYIQQLAQSMNVAYHAGERQITTRIEAESIEMGVHRAFPAALILNEVMANAFKHAFPDHQRDGEIRIWFGESEPHQLELRIRDNGLARTSCLHQGDRNSVALRIIHILAKQLDGAFERLPSPDSHFVLRFPAGSSSRESSQRNRHAAASD